MADDKGVKDGESSSDSSTGNDSTDTSNQSGGDGSGDSSSVSKESNEALAKERDRLLKEISDARAERRTLNSGATQDQGSSSSDSSSKSGTDHSDLADAARKRAFRVFITEHPEYQDDTKWKQLETTYLPRRSKVIWEDVKEDLEDAHVVLNREAISSEAAKKAADATARKMAEADSADIGGTSSSTSSGESKEELTPDEKKAFEKLRRADPAMTEEKYLKAKKRLKEG